MCGGLQERGLDDALMLKKGAYSVGLLPKVEGMSYLALAKVKSLYFGV